MNKERIYLHKKAFFKEAKYYNNICLVLEYTTLCLTIICLFFDLKFLYVLVFIFQPTIAAFGNYSFNSRSLALELSRIEILTLINENEVFEKRLSDIIGGASSRIRSFVKKMSFDAGYYNSKDSSDVNSIMLRIQENTYWNHFLFLKTAKSGFMKFFGVFLLLFFLLIVTLYYKQKAGYSLIDFIVVIFSFALIWKAFDKYLKLWGASKQMSILDNMISSFNAFDIKTALIIFTEYNITLHIAIDIEDKMYQKYRNQLNEGWMCRINKKHT
jgi:hypothetical protein